MVVAIQQRNVVIVPSSKLPFLQLLILQLCPGDNFAEVEPVPAKDFFAVARVSEGFIKFANPLPIAPPAVLEFHSCSSCTPF
ncbi:hypothetical protein [Noviherbaspirillum aerium]|uniref:hypothetical protein n=1 Tax=Noviherbaspirillum aerium TaxID=2588497 RepID=UPI00124DBB33|nr:hypothetical protein [Noviherbaspirillum aerium]